MNVEDNFRPNTGSVIASFVFEIVIVLGLLAALIGYNPDHHSRKEI